MADRMRSLDEQFQSALPRGERLCLSVSKSGIPYFNPRSHEGSDLIPFKDHRNKGISIRAPTRGATSAICITICICGISIRAPTRGATYALAGILPVADISIRAPTRGATRCCVGKCIRLIISIRAPTRGATNAF